MTFAEVTMLELGSVWCDAADIYTYDQIALFEVAALGFFRKWRLAEGMLAG